MTPADFKSWRKRHNLAMRQVAEMFGCHISTIWRYEHGEMDIPKWMPFACEAIDQRQDVAKLWRDVTDYTRKFQPTEE